jgi:hypothetical protein
MCTPDSVSRGTRKRSLSRHSATDETNAAERKRFARRQRNSKLVQGLHAFRHQSFATRLIDRRDGAICHDDVQTVMTRRNGRRQTGWSAADNKYIHRIRKHSLRAQC